MSGNQFNGETVSDDVRMKEQPLSETAFPQAVNSSSVATDEVSSVVVVYQWEEGDMGFGIRTTDQPLQCASGGSGSQENIEFSKDTSPHYNDLLLE